MGGVRAEANITRDGEGGKGCLDFPHLSKKLKEKGRLFLVPCVSLCFFQNTHKFWHRGYLPSHTHTHCGAQSGHLSSISSLFPINILFPSFSLPLFFFFTSFFLLFPPLFPFISFSFYCFSRRYNKVPNLGLGPKWDQGAKMVPKKSQFYFQVPNSWFYLQMMLKRGAHM